MSCKTRPTRCGSFTDEALRAAVEMVKGSPYMLQLVGHHSWLASLAPLEPISLADVEAARGEVDDLYEENVTEDTVNELTETEATIVAYLLANAQPCDVRNLADEVAERCEITPERAAKVVKQMRLRGTLQRRRSHAVAIAPGSGIEHESAGQLIASKLGVTLPRSQAVMGVGPADASSIRSPSARPCNEWMPRAQDRCVLKRGHKGGHRRRRDN